VNWPPLRTVRSLYVAAVPDGVVFQCDPVMKGCAPDGTVAWRCSSDCIYDECEINLVGHGLRGRFPDLGDVRCAQRITLMCAASASLILCCQNALRILSALACQKAL
jgi:hypothetical protein